MYFLKGLYCSVGLYNKQGMYHCSVYQLRNCSLRSCRELAICTAKLKYFFFKGIYWSDSWYIKKTGCKQLFLIPIVKIIHDLLVS
jgi:hypothetical protein